MLTLLENAFLVAFCCGCCLQGGATKFDHLQLGVQPQKGKALLFFPSFSGGRPDARWVKVQMAAVSAGMTQQLQ